MISNTESNYEAAAARLIHAKEDGKGLLIVTGAGMSVASGVPVFRMSDGSMSADFIRFLGDYNAARKKHGLQEADDWFSFSVPEMFRTETAYEAWQYWRWRMLRALVNPAEDYSYLMKIIRYIGAEKVFVVTSNCDMLHQTAGVNAESIQEIHGSLGLLQCSTPCSQHLIPVEQNFLERLRDEPDWVPQCPHCQKACLRPNVMIFGDHALVESHLDGQEKRLEQFQKSHEDKPLVVLEIGAGTVVASIRYLAEVRAAANDCLIRVNPSESECETMQVAGNQLQGRYFPLAERSTSALKRLCEEIGIRE